MSGVDWAQTIEVIDCHRGGFYNVWASAPGSGRMLGQVQRVSAGVWIARRHGDYCGEGVRFGTRRDAVDHLVGMTDASPAQLRYLSDLAAKGTKPAKRILEQASRRGSPVTREEAGRVLSAVLGDTLVQSITR